MKSFLSQVASYYNANVCRHDLARYCFVFPNKRSGQFFVREFQQLLPSGDVMLMPDVLTISDFVARVAGRIVAGDLECLFVLYRAYCEVMGQESQPFNDFVLWASLIVRDFDDIDTCLIDHTELYKTVNDLNDIKSDPLSDDLKEEIRRYLDVPKDDGNPDKLFVREKYMKLWNALPDIYCRYHELMENELDGKVSTGRAYRLAAEQLAGAGQLPSAMRHVRYVMVGFLWLSRSERAIFEWLRQKNLADFWWDDASAMFQGDFSPAATLIAGNVEAFPPPQAIDRLPSETVIKEEEDRFKDKYKIVKIPSHVGQAKVVRRLLDDTGVSSDETRTAIVLPDDTLLLPLLNSLGPVGAQEKIKQLNVTIGYSMKSSDIVSLMNLVARCHSRAHRHNDGSVTYYREDVRDLLSHPVLKTAYPDDVSKMLKVVDELPNYEVPSATLYESQNLRPLFDTADITEQEGTVDQALAYIDSIHAFVDSLRERQDGHAGGAEGDTVTLQGEYMRVFCRQLQQVRALICRFREAVSGSTVLYLVNRLAATCVIPFTGEPLQGVQVMGTLETRCLDFENLIILSANERVLPQCQRQRSFIANWLRHIYGMPTIEDAETMSSYYFFRLIGRASKVRLVYDTSHMSGLSNEPSRFISQLSLLYRKCELPEVSVVVEKHAIEPRKITVPNPGKQKMLAIYGANGSKTLSASAINKYIRCPLRFYLHYIAGLPDDNEPSDFMDGAEFGSIVHDSLMLLYEPYKEKQLTPGILCDMRVKELDEVVLRATNHCYNHYDYTDSRITTPLTGNALILNEVIKTFVKRAIGIDEKLLVEGHTLTVVDCEHEMDCVLNVNGIAVKLKFIIDRLDRLDGTLRIVDYKTGKDAVKVNDIEQMFQLDKTGNFCHALVQLMVYCNAYAQHEGYAGKILPVIYKLQEPDESGFKIGEKFGKKIQFKQLEFEADNKENTEFLNQLETQLSNMMGGKSFGQTDAVGACEYCSFKSFCNK